MDGREGSSSDCGLAWGDGSINMAEVVFTLLLGHVHTIIRISPNAFSFSSLSLSTASRILSLSFMPRRSSTNVLSHSYNATRCPLSLDANAMMHALDRIPSHWFRLSPPVVVYPLLRFYSFRPPGNFLFTDVFLTVPRSSSHDSESVWGGRGEGAAMKQKKWWGDWEIN